jgi:glutathione S-transferase
MQAYYGRLQLLEKMASTPRGEFLAGNQVSIADCIAFSTLQTGVEFFGIPLPGGCPTLQDWYARFAKRPSGAVPPYPPPVLEITRGSLAHTLNS